MSKKNFKSCCGSEHHSDNHESIKDPVCGMDVQQLPHESKSRNTVNTAGTLFTCPMHPEIQQDHQGSCPKCGMALEPMLPSLTEEENPELADFTKRFWWTLPFTVCVAILAMFGHTLGWFESKTQSWIELILSLPVIVWAGLPIFVRGLQSIKNLSPNMWTLISLGTGAAFVYSIIATTLPEIFPLSFMSMGRINVYFEAAVVIISLTLLGQILELKARSKTSTAIKALLKLYPKTARRINSDNTEEDIDINLVHLGDTLRIRPGEKVPTDGVIINGTSSIDESMITGEPIPEIKSKDDKVIGATLNINGSLIMRVEKIGSETVLSQIINMVVTAQRSKAPMQSLADVIAGYFVVAVTAVALVTLLVWGLWGPNPSWVYGIINAVAVLIIACPCALGLATPMSIMVATGNAATDGVLFRDAAAIEKLCKINVLVLDKTGTLTEGKPSYDRAISTSEYSEQEMLRLAASLNQGSEHPLADAIIRAAREQELNLETVDNFEAIAGLGVQGTIPNQKISLGNSTLMQQQGVNIGDIQSQAETLRTTGASIVFMAINGSLIGLLSISDRIKSSSKDAVNQLNSLGIKVIMATGDGVATAKFVGKILGIEEIYGEVKPQDKLKLVEKLQSEGYFVAMAGDGINDAPALAKADVGIAMGTGTDVAMNSAQITLVKGDLRGIIAARKISVASVANMKQNLMFALVYNGVGVPIAAGILYPWTGWLLSPMLAALAMSLSSVSVISNALRLRKRSVKP